MGSLLIARTIRSILATLPAPALERLRFVTFTHREQPTADDVKRGVTPTTCAYFFGHVGELEQDDEPSSALPDDEPPVGEIVIFTGRLRPCTVEQLARVLLHEVGHALGYDHDVLEEELGLVA